MKQLAINERLYQARNPLYSHPKQSHYQNLLPDYQ
jgi:hypothetical protein